MGRRVWINDRAEDDLQAIMREFGHRKPRAVVEAALGKYREEYVDRRRRRNSDGA